MNTRTQRADKGAKPVFATRREDFFRSPSPSTEGDEKTSGEASCGVGSDVASAGFPDQKRCAGWTRTRWTRRTPILVSDVEIGCAPYPSSRSLATKASDAAT